jgi:hypothetical protein
MDIKELNKSQLILLAVLLSFVTSIATGITTVTLMEQAPNSVTVPINRIVRETVEKIVPTESKTTQNNVASLSADDKKLLEELKAIKPLTMTLVLKGETPDKDKTLGTGIFLGENKVVITSLIPEPKEGEVYVIMSVLGEQKVSKVKQQKDFTIVELVKSDTPPPVTPITPPVTDNPITQ